MVERVNFPERYEVTQPKKPKKGGSKLGKVLGGAAGLAAGITLAATTGGAGAAAMPALAKAGAVAGLAGGGMAIGGLAGGLADPAKAGVPGSVEKKHPLEVVAPKSTIDRRQEILSRNPLLDVKSAIEAMPTAPRDIRAEYLPPLLMAYGKLHQQGGRNA